MAREEKGPDGSRLGLKSFPITVICWGGQSCGSLKPTPGAI